MPVRLIRPSVGLSPTTPQRAAGCQNPLPAAGVIDVRHFEVRIEAHAHALEQAVGSEGDDPLLAVDQERVSVARLGQALDEVEHGRAAELFARIRRPEDGPAAASSGDVAVAVESGFQVEVADLEEAWNTRFEADFGVAVDKPSNGVLQDVHWSFGLFGYFSTYALGNLVSAQLWEKIQGDIPDLDDKMRTGEFSKLLGWLNENVHAHGSKYYPQDLVQRITGSKINGDAYIRYLNNKFGDIYSL